MLLTKSTSFIIGPVASLLGYIMNGIFWLLENIGIPNIGLSIILFTIVIYMLLMPMTIKQQKFSKLQAIMQPEINKIQKKYKGKNNDQAAMMKMNEETQAVYEKYGVSPMGSCLQLIIQMPILFALYRVIWIIPAYVTSVKNAFMPLAQELMNLSGVEEFMAEIAKTNSVTFKEMTDYIDRLVKEVYETELIAQQAQIQYLQAQMNPHFLFNVLSMIEMRAAFNNDTEVQQMIYRLSKLYQGKIFRKNEHFIYLEEEMEIVDFYL